MSKQSKGELQDAIRDALAAERDEYETAHHIHEVIAERSRYAKGSA